MSKTSTNIFDEADRAQIQDIQKSYFKTRSKLGVVSAVHEKYYAVKVRLDENGQEANCGALIAITNPWQQLIHDFGPLRVGLRVELNYEGDQESFSTATIIGLEGEPIAQNQEASDKDLGLYEIFTPGI